MLSVINGIIIKIILIDHLSIQIQPAIQSVSFQLLLTLCKTEGSNTFWQFQTLPHTPITNILHILILE